MKAITRRAALAVLVTLPLLPVSALATPAEPAVEAYQPPAPATSHAETRRPQGIRDRFVQPLSPRQAGARMNRSG